MSARTCLRRSFNCSTLSHNTLFDLPDRGLRAVSAGSGALGPEFELLHLEFGQCPKCCPHELHVQRGSYPRQLFLYIVLTVAHFFTCCPVAPSREDANRFHCFGQPTASCRRSDDLVEAADLDHMADRLGKRAYRKPLARLAEPLGHSQTDSKTCAAHKGDMLEVHDQGVVSGIDPEVQHLLERVGVAAVKTTLKHRDQDSIFPAPLDVDIGLHPLPPLRTETAAKA